MFTSAEENYLKAIYKFQGKEGQAVQTGVLADGFKIQAPSVTDMLKRLSEKGLVNYQKSKGARLTQLGEQIAINILRRHRIWETFLVHTLGFNWGEVHDLAEQLEHVRSEEIVNRLEKFLGFPKFDPHGDPIPDVDGVIPVQKARPLTEAKVGLTYRLVGIMDDSSEFLDFLNRIGLKQDIIFKCKQFETFDGSWVILPENGTNKFISAAAAAMVLVLEKESI